MRNRSNRIIFALVIALTVFSVIVVWPNKPTATCPTSCRGPRATASRSAAWSDEAMRLGLDLKGGTYVLLEADTSRLPPGTDIDDAMDGVKDVLERRVNAFGVSETEITREGPNRLAVQLPGIDPEAGARADGQDCPAGVPGAGAGRLPATSSARTPDGSTYAVAVPAGGVRRGRQRTRRMTCPPSDEGGAGVVMWKPATGTDSQGVRARAHRQLPEAQRQVSSALRPRSPSSSHGEGGLLFEQITGRLRRAAPGHLPGRRADRRADRAAADHRRPVDDHRPHAGRGEDAGHPAQRRRAARAPEGDPGDRGGRHAGRARRGPDGAGGPHRHPGGDGVHGPLLPAAGRPGRRRPRRLRLVRR